MDNQDNVTGVEFTPEETAYFESGGATPPTKQEQAQPAPAGQEQDAEAGADDAAGEEQVNVKGADGERKFVSLKALQEERQKRREEKQARDERIRQLEIENARVLERLKAFEPKPEAPALPPNPEEDVFGAIRHTGEQVKSVEQQLAEMKRAEEAKAQQQFVMSSYAQDAARVRAEKPDFNEAYRFLVDGRKKEIEAIGFRGQAAEKALYDDEIGIVLTAMRQGMSPAETVYNIAVARGYKAKAPDTSAQDKLAAIEKGQAANRSLSSAGGEGGAEAMTVERLLAMPNDEFAAYDKKNPGVVRRLMGGR